MVWWIVAGVIVVPLLALLVALAAMRSRVSELDRVKALAAERLAAGAGRLSSAQQPLQAQLTGLQRQAASAQARIARRRAGTRPPEPRA